MPHIADIVGILARASVLSAVAGAAFAQVSDSGAEAGELDEIVVTATRSAQAASRVPVSLAAYTQEGLDSQGVRQIDDVTRLTPGVQFNRSGYGLTSNIAIRGISSAAGSATTGVYIDDTPIQVRSIGNSASNAYPAIFDLERVEVLRGPQGTLFGAGSQGGTVRFISPSPVLGGDLQGYSRAEIAATRRGALTYEVGSALGGAVVEDKVGFRLSGYTRRDGGFVDRVPYPDGNGSNPSLGFPKKDSNSVETQSARLALTFKPTDDFAITPSVYYQNLKSNDTAVYWESVFGTPISDRGSGRYVNGNKIASTNKDSFVLPALKLRWDLGAVTLSSDTSYFRRRESGIYDYGAFINNIFGFGSDPTPTLSIPGNYDLGRLSNAQNNLTQELRLNSSDADARLTYVLGLFLSRDKQRSHQDIVNPYFESIVGMPVDVFYGLPRSPEGYTYVDNFFTTDKQTAVFGELGYEVAAGLRVIAGLRYARTRLDFRTTRDGPAQGGPGSDSGRQKENPLTPKLGLSYQVNPSNLVYATAAKGFRIGGVNRGIPTNATCGADLAAIGLTEAPTSYDSDKVWSYEVGSKNRLADGRMRIATSAYYIKWRDIVNFVNLPNCGFAFTDNLGSATIRGFDLQVDLQPRDELTLGLAVGYNRGTYDKTIASGGPKNLITKGYTTGGAPWVIAASGQYDFVLGGRDSYFRVDVSHRTRNNGLTDISDPQGPDYDPQVPRNPALTDVRLRAGMMFGGLDLSAFVNNATNEHDRMFVDHVTAYGQIYQAAPVRPITMGVSAAYRF